MKLQVNTSGAWKDILIYSSENCSSLRNSGRSYFHDNDRAVRAAVETLGIVAENSKLAFRIIGDDGNVIAYCEQHNSYKWRNVN